MRKKIDAILDALYLAESMTSYTACLATDSDIAARSLQADFYSLELLPLALVEIAAFVCYSYTAKLYSGSQEQKDYWMVNFMVLSWPYFRDFISGLKNGRHAIINISFLIQHSAQQAVYHLANPIGIGVGVILAFVLTWYRKMNNDRLEAIAFNNALAEHIENASEIKNHSSYQSAINFLAAGFDGLTDGMYLYGCLFLLLQLGIAPVTGGAPLIIAAAFIGLITLVSFISKMHDEYLFQRDLEASVLKCEIKLLENKTSLEPLDIEDENHPLLTTIEQKQQTYKTLTTPTDPRSLSFIGKLIFFSFRGALSGAKNAVAALNSIKAMIPGAIIAAIIGVCKIFTAICYSIYLALKSAETEYVKRKIMDKFGVFRQDFADSIRNNRFLRNDFV